MQSSGLTLLHYQTLSTVLLRGDIPMRLAGLLLLFGPAVAMAQVNDPALAHAKQLLAERPIFDGHNDLPWEIRTNAQSKMDVDKYDLRQRTPGATDLARLKEGGVGAQFWSVYIPGEAKDSGYARMQLEQIDIARRMIAKYPDALQLCLSADDVVRARQAGKLASMLGIEGGFFGCITRLACAT
jgi:membrane dipeptidase